MKLGKLNFISAELHLDLIAESTARFVEAKPDKGILVCEIKSEFSDTRAFCEYYDIGLNISANCVIVEAKRADKIWYAACLVLATDRADINGTIRNTLGARKVSFAPMSMAVELSGMEYGGITPLGLPTDWPILVDNKVAANKYNIIGSGKRASKLLVSGELLAGLSQAQVLTLTK